MKKSKKQAMTVPKGMVPEIEGKREAMEIMKMAGKKGKSKSMDRKRRKKVRAMC